MVVQEAQLFLNRVRAGLVRLACPRCRSIYTGFSDVADDRVMSATNTAPMLVVQAQARASAGALSEVGGGRPGPGGHAVALRDPTRPTEIWTQQQLSNKSVGLRSGVPDLSAYI